MTIRRHIYNGFIIQARIASDRMSAKIHVIGRTDPDHERVLAGPFTSLDKAMHWIDSPLTQGLHRADRIEVE